MILLVLGAMGSPEAGRVGENNRGESWLAAPTPAESRTIAQPCSQLASLEARQLVFEKIRPGDLDADDIQRIAAGTHEVVSFQWNAATGELTFDTSAPTGVFSDLATSFRASRQDHPICVSR